MPTGEKYNRDTKIAVVKLVTEDGRSSSSVANEYGIHENTVYKWIKQFNNNPDKAFPGSGNHAPADELERLRRRNRELEQENEFLKKVSAYFAKNRQ